MLPASSGQGSGTEDTNGVNGGAGATRDQGRRDGCARRRRKECELGVGPTALCSLSGVEPQWLFWVLWTPHLFAKPS